MRTINFTNNVWQYLPFEGTLSQEDAEWQAMSDTVIYFLENTGYDPGDGAVNRFIKDLYQHLSF